MQGIHATRKRLRTTTHCGLSLCTVFTQSRRDRGKYRRRGQNDPPVRKRPEWDRALDVFGYTGIRRFERAPRRDPAREKRKLEIVVFFLTFHAKHDILYAVYISYITYS